MKSSEVSPELLVEYLLVISIAGTCNFAIKELQKHFGDPLNLRKEQIPIPHITVLSFCTRLPNNNELLQRLTKAARFVKPLEVKWSDFRVYNSNAFLVVDDKKPIADIRKIVKDELKRRPFSLISYNQVSAPHLTLVKGLNELQCKATENSFDERTLPLGFFAEEMISLKRFKTGKYEYVESFKFLGIDPIVYIQISIF